jgi:OOP family OmpA-OmpF porin
MRTTICVFVATAFALVGAENAFADAEAGQGYFTGMISYIDDDEKRNVYDGVNGGQFGLGYALNEDWNIEGLIMAAAPNGDPTGQEHLGIGIDVQRVFARSERFSPYLHAGIGYFSNDVGIMTSRETGSMFSVGAGFLLDMFGSNVALRGEWRHRADTALADDTLTDNLYSLGLQIPFGSGKPRWVDSDGDGVADGMDRCPNTPAGATVDSYGCEVDSDGDGVVDSLDQCPGTPAGVKVDAKGCPLDSDGDGVTDDKDKCPGTPAGAAVDETGCELDSDGDGVVDRLDECPGTPKGVQVGIRGCPIADVVTLKGVNFESNSDVLRPGAASVLDQVVGALEKNPTIKIEVGGHTDSVGAADYNQGLSERRANTIRDYLINAGISGDRMTVRGYGESAPIADNSTAEGKAQNRRVVLTITER